MDTTLTNPNANFFQTGQGGNPYPISNTSTTITPTTIGTQPLNIAPTTQVPIPNIANLVSTDALTTPIVPVAPQPTSPSLTDRLAGLFGQSKNKEADTAAAVDTATSPYTQQLNEINTQIKMNQANAIANQEKAMQQGETTGFASREAQNVARSDAIETLKLSAIQAGLQGNIALAEQHATKAVEAKYSQLNSDIEQTKTNIYNNFDSFSSSEKKRAENTLLRVDANDFFAKNAMESEKAVQSIVLTAIQQSSQNGTTVPSLILSQAQKLNDPSQALQLLSPYLKDTAKIQSQIDAHNTAVAQQAKIYSDINLSKEELKLKYSDNGKPLTDTQATSLGYANRIAQAGTVIDKLGNQFTTAGSLLGQYEPNLLKSADRQQYEQAQRNFVNAVLRKESGAVISPEEFNNAKLQYFPQPGDTAGVLQQKKQNRDTIYQNFLRNAGQSTTQTQDIQVVNDKTYVKAADGLYYPQ